MIIKTKDPNCETVDLLRGWLNTGRLSPQSAKAIKFELGAIRRGAKGERECAFHLDGVIKDHPNRVIIHDLRIEHDGEVAQFDHLMINRYLEFWILESKSYLNGFMISDRGEFEYWSGGRYHAMPSPIEQVKRQARILEKIIKAHDLAPRGLFGAKKPTVKTAVLVDPKTRVIRPERDAFNTDMVIKADAFMTEYQKQNDQMGTLELMGRLTNMVKKGFIIEIAQRLAAMHTPLVIDYRAKFAIDELAVRPRGELTEPAAPIEVHGESPSPEPAAPVTAEAPEKPGAPNCPRCGQAMLLRTTKRGDNAGKQFWGCPGYPKCRGVIAIDDVGEDAEDHQADADAPCAGQAATGGPAAPQCPRCGEAMVLRTAKRGENSGNRFWGCPRYPKCRGMADYDADALAHPGQAHICERQISTGDGGKVASDA